MNIFQLVVIGTGALLACALAYFALRGPSGGKKSVQRLQTLRERHSQSTQDKVEAQLRKAVAARRPRVHQAAGSDSRIAALALRLHRSGKPWSVAQYFYASAGLALAVATLVYLKWGALLLAITIGVLVGAGLPHLVISRAIKKRTLAFNAKFPDAIELLVRGLRSGLPVTETLGVVAREVPGPVSEEFKAVIDRMKLGRTMDDALQETADRLDTPEFAFFCITLAIQRETGGNLAETLSNLADVLRKRAQMKLKIRALSSESKASAYIVGALPFVVFALIWWINPTYIGKFFVDQRLIVVGIGGFVWMSIGGLVMAKMVNFEI
ncbi:type II secretion system F family protein [Caenibius sp. WL]|uniref:type II secretion system F family protein n=1 Tax=Caenibius sp. WL TaxID=2872646 RepID=UPI001C99EB9D|nr:type II secretion system F family protein [Caenibius sp. WL]QZP08004.1 type II secretion system F family protein [Caenibius sp. WL]